MSDQSSLITAILTFQSWTKEIQEVCILLAKSEEVLPVPIVKETLTPKQKRIIQEIRPRKNWTLEERQLLFEEFDRVGCPNQRKAKELSKTFGCSPTAISSQYYSHYKIVRGLKKTVPQANQ